MANANEELYGKDLFGEVITPKRAILATKFIMPPYNLMQGAN